MKIEDQLLFREVKIDVNIDFDDILFFFGLILTTTGLWLFNPALSLIVAGVIFMLVGFMRAGGE